MQPDAVLMIGFGGPEKPEDIRPFLGNVTRGRRIPPARLEEVAHHYEQIGGRSPLNELTFGQARALEETLRKRGSPMPVFVGMRNWHPYLADTIRGMAAAGVTKAVGLIMALQQSDSGWNQYRRNVEEALADAGVPLDLRYAPPAFDHPGFIEAAARRVGECLERVPDGRRADTALIFTAHSIPMSDPLVDRYMAQLRECAERVADRAGHSRWRLAYQSRSGRPQDPWLEPDINDVLRELADGGMNQVVVAPIGFLCDHVEVLYDLDFEAARTAKGRDLTMHRAGTVHDDPAFIDALADLVTGTLHGH
jgi:ferrochelatase